MTTRALVIGAGGLGGPLAIALGAAGFELTIVDPDAVEASNLHRQVQFTPADVGAPKAAGSRLRSSRAADTRAASRRAGPRRTPTISAAILTSSSTAATTRRRSSRSPTGRSPPAAHTLIAAAIQLGGSVFAGAPGYACYRCLFEAPAPALACSTAGVLGPVVGAIGGLAAALAIGLARGDRRHAGSIFVFDDLRTGADPRIVRFAPRPGCTACARRAAAGARGAGRRDRRAPVIVVRVPGPLRAMTGGAADVELRAATVRDALAELDRKHPGVAARVLDAAGKVRPFVRIFVGAADIGELGGLDTPLADRDELSIRARDGRRRG